MINIFKKIITIFIVVLLVVTTAFAQDNSQKLDIEKLMKREAKSIEKLEMFMRKMEAKNNYKDKYAGAFFDNEGNLNINIVGNYSGIANEISIKDVKYNSVKHSYKELNKALEDLSKNMQELGINIAYLDEEKNAIIVKCKDKEKVKKYNNNSYIMFEDTSDTNLVLTTDVVNGEYGAVKGISGNFTIGFEQ